MRPPLLPALPVAEAMPAPAARLSGDVLPQRYALELDVDPRKTTFTGKVTILVDVHKPTSHVVIHARGPRVITATITSGATTVDASVTTRSTPAAHEPDELVLSVPHPLAVGAATITIMYEAPFADTLSGLYRVKEGGLDYAFTQFESTDARRAFPCFDEPGFKTAFDVTIRVPAGMKAVSNAKETSRVDDAGATTFHFATTPPLPTYLVAFAIGDLEIVAGQTSPTPIRLVTTKGKSALGAGALEVTTKLLSILEAYFGIKYPYDKLDVVAVPNFGAGAMENAGLVTFREELLLLGSKPSVRARRAEASVIAHELAHQWFGDLVTMAWWDDIWLNEGFATWMQTKAMADFDHDFRGDEEATVSAERVKDADGLASARAIRQPVASSEEAMESFDGITYQKGAAVLRMLEHFAGKEAFQAGVRDYLTSHAFKNAVANDLLVALAKSSNSPELPAIASTFLDQPGVPVIEQKGVCTEAKGQWSLTVTQARAWRPIGGTTSEDARWRLPVCSGTLLRVDASSDCGVLEARQSVVRAGAGNCPASINEGAFAYARTSLTPQAIADLAKGFDGSKGDASDRIAFLANLWSDVRSGHQDVGVLMKTLPAFDHDTSRAVVEELLAILYSARDALVEDDAKKAFRAYALARLMPHKLRLLKAPADEESALLGRSVSYALVELAEDAPSIKEEETVARAWLADPRSADQDRAQVAVELLGRHATTADVDALRKLVLSADTPPQDRVAALRGAMASADPAMMKSALDWALANVKLQDYRYVFDAAYAHHDSKPTVLGWVMDHYAGLRAKLPGPMGRGLAGNIGVVCTQSELDRAKAFFEPKLGELEGANRIFAQSVETASLCVALRTAQAGAMTKALNVKK